MKRPNLLVAFLVSLFLSACGGGGGATAVGGPDVTGITPASAISTVSAN
jgi:hypothetical protein